MDFILLEQKIPVAKTNILNMINEKGDTIYIVYDSYCHAFIDGFWTCTFDKINLQNLSKKMFLSVISQQFGNKNVNSGYITSNDKVYEKYTKGIILLKLN